MVRKAVVDKQITSTPGRVIFLAVTKVYTQRVLSTLMNYYSKGARVWALKGMPPPSHHQRCRNCFNIFLYCNICRIQT